MLNDHGVKSTNQQTHNMHKESDSTDKGHEPDVSRKPSPSRSQAHSNVNSILIRILIKLGGNTGRATAYRSGYRDRESWLVDHRERGDAGTALIDPNSSWTIQ